MNNIYIINNYFDNIITLNFQNNNFKQNDLLHNFEIIDKNNILIKWHDSPEIYHTYDSYLYFSVVSDVNLKNIFKKIFLIHNDWNDSAIINLNTNKLSRIQFNDQYGDIIDLSNDNLIINWNHWGKEKYQKIDNFTYIAENSKYLINKDINLTNHQPIHIFMHICMIENWKSIFDEQIYIIKKSGLYDKCEKIHLGIVVNIINISEILNLFNDNLSDNLSNKFNILYIDSNINLYEIHTINHIKRYCNTLNHEIYILYIHTKGVRRAGNENVIISWRKMMEYFLIEKYEESIKYLDTFDTIGNNIVNMHALHYSGNFWWSKKSYIDKLPYLDLDLTHNAINTRYIAENWILSNYPNANVGVIFQDITNTHPYHRHVFDYYKDLKIIVKRYF